MRVEWVPAGLERDGGRSAGAAGPAGSGPAGSEASRLETVKKVVARLICG